jgi:beta,beta-carotene 9',10'-dioxygenase
MRTPSGAGTDHLGEDLSMTDNYFISQNSETERTKLQVDGSLPKWLTGKLVRNGPAIFEAGSTKLRHWFDGYGMLHGFMIADGTVYYQSKLIQSPEYLNNKDPGSTLKTITWGTASDPCRSIFRRFFASFTAGSNTAVNVVQIGLRYFTTSDISTINEFDIKDLDTLSTLTTTKTGTMAAHPAFTSAGRVWNMISHFGPVVKNEIISFDDSAKYVSHNVTTRRSTYYFHSFANTDRYFVAIEIPLYLSFSKLVVSGVINKSFYECFRWDKKATNKFHIFDRQTGALTRIDSDLKFFYFHTINAYEEGGKLVIDLCGYENNKIIDDFYFAVLTTTGIPEEHKASLRRVTLDLARSSATMEDLDIDLELPNINCTYAGTKYRYAYGIQSSKGCRMFSDSIAKYDFEKRQQIVWREKQLIPGEPIFVAAPDAKREDDGVLLVVCHDGEKHTACLVVLDAQNLRQIAVMYAPKHIPISLHGCFYNV